MKRRDFLRAAAVSCVAFAPFTAVAASLEYTPGLVKERLAAGDTVLATFKAEWCSTCAAQERVMNALKAGNPSYERTITFVNVDWDTYGRSALAQELRIPRRSTLVLLRGDQELGRIVADTRERAIRTLLDTALTE